MRSEGIQHVEPTQKLTQPEPAQVPGLDPARACRLQPQGDADQAPFLISPCRRAHLQTAFLGAALVFAPNSGHVGHYNRKRVGGLDPEVGKAA